eukprot:scaffold13323_cov207-Alexandrium_tamarense.AAC.57
MMLFANKLCKGYQFGNSYIPQSSSRCCSLNRNPPFTLFGTSMLHPPKSVSEELFVECTLEKELETYIAAHDPAIKRKKVIPSRKGILGEAS